jgi:hypothetical protein
MRKRKLRIKRMLLLLRLRGKISLRKPELTAPAGSEEKVLRPAQTGRTRLKKRKNSLQRELSLEERELSPVRPSSEWMQDDLFVLKKKVRRKNATKPNT